MKMNKSRQEKVEIIMETIGEEDKFYEIQTDLFRIIELVQDLETTRHRVHRDLADLIQKVARLSMDLEEKK